MVQFHRLEKVGEAVKLHLYIFIYSLENTVKIEALFPPWRKTQGRFSCTNFCQQKLYCDKKCCSYSDICATPGTLWNRVRGCVAVITGEKMESLRCPQSLLALGEDASLTPSQWLFKCLLTFLWDSWTSKEHWSCPWQFANLSSRESEGQRQPQHGKMPLGDFAMHQRARESSSTS